LELDMPKPSDVATVVQVRRLDGQIVTSRTIPAGKLRGELDVDGISGPMVVQILRGGALIQASLVSNPR
jgi:hypothetical protein